MKKLFYVLAGLAFTVQVQAQDVKQRMQQLVDSVYKANPSGTGFMVHVEAPGKQISWGYAAGHNNRATLQKLTVDQPLRIASNTKPYVAAAILRLVEESKVQVDQPIEKLLTPATEKLLSGTGYDTRRITLKHLLSHTSGIKDYVNDAYFNAVVDNPDHAWSRSEQIELAMRAGAPYALPGDTFRYADINYLLLSEVLETQTGMPFYEAMRKLLNYEKLKLNNTWFAKLEKAPAGTKPAAHQYWDKYKWDSYDLDPSWDLYGGGGMMATEKDMALFFQYLFNGKVIQNKQVLELMHQDVPPDLAINYCLGIRKIKVAGYTAYNHGGGLGTDVVYIPQLNLSVAVAALEANHRPQAMKISEEIVKLLGARVPAR